MLEILTLVVSCLVTTAAPSAAAHAAAAPPDTAGHFGPELIERPGRWPFVVVFPQKPLDYEEWEEREPLVLGVLDQARREFRFDPRRVALAGMSQGGHGVWMLGARYPEPGVRRARAPGEDPRAPRLTRTLNRGSPARLAREDLLRALDGTLQRGLQVPGADVPVEFRHRH